MTLPIIQTSPGQGLRNTVPGTGFTFGVDGGGTTGVCEIIPQSITTVSTHPSLIQVAQINFTAAQWNVLFTTPATLIPAPGAGKSILVDYALLRYVYGGTAFTGGGTVSIQYSGGVAAATTVASTQITAAASSDNLMTSTGTLAATQNAAITISVATANFATGNGTFQVYVYYSTL
jgi:hypothetical protein